MPIVVEGITSQQLGRTTAEWVRTATIEIAERGLREEVAKGFDNEPVVITDGVPRRDYLQVKPYGKIEFARRPNMAEAVLWALTDLQKRSPVLTGRYASTHTVMINGAEIQGNIALALRNIGPTDRVQIVNPQPYARKIEGATASGKTGRVKRKGISNQAKNGVYRAVLRELVSRYGRSMFFDYKMVPLNLGVKVWGAVGGGRYKVKGKWTNRKPRGRILRNQVYPALQFFIKPVELPN
jgi:hypothetical protein